MKSEPLSYLSIKSSPFLNGHHVLLCVHYVTLVTAAAARHLDVSTEGELTEGTAGLAANWVEADDRLGKRLKLNLGERMFIANIDRV